MVVAVAHAFVDAQNRQDVTAVGEGEVCSERPYDAGRSSARGRSRGAQERPGLLSTLASRSPEGSAGGRLDNMRARFTRVVAERPAIEVVPVDVRVSPV